MLSSLPLYNGENPLYKLKIFDVEEEKCFELASTCKYIRLLFKKDEQLSEFEIPEINITNAAKTEIKKATDGFREAKRLSTGIPYNIKSYSFIAKSVHN